MASTPPVKRQGVRDADFRVHDPGSRLPEPLLRDFTPPSSPAGIVDSGARAVTWVKLDDGVAFHPKVVLAGNAAFGAWARMAAWCAQHLTDGRVPRPMALTIAGDPGTVEQLVAVKLLDAVADGYLVHDYLDYNKTREQVLAEREFWKNRQGRSRESRGDSQRDTPRDTSGDSQRDSLLPVPVPVPVPVKCPNPENNSAASLHRAASRPTEPEDFPRFWAVYPRRQGRKAAVAAWRKLSAADRAAVFADLALAGRPTRDPQWIARTADDGRLIIPLPTTYLRGEKWTDEWRPVKTVAQQFLPNETTYLCCGERRAFTAHNKHLDAAHGGREPAAQAAERRPSGD